MTFQAAFAAALIFGAAAVFAQAQAASAQADSTPNTWAEKGQNAPNQTGYRMGQPDAASRSQRHTGYLAEGAGRQQTERRSFGGERDHERGQRHDAHHRDGHHNNQRHHDERHHDEYREMSRHSSAGLPQQQADNSLMAVILGLTN
jgi:hypothetical protein